MKRFLIHIILLFPVLAVAQKQLTLQNIIDITLKNNYDIKIARNYAEIDKMKNSFGYAGGLPVISANAGGNGSVKNISQELTDGTASSIGNAQNTLIDAGIYGSMTLFNGFKIIATRERLNLLQQQSELMLNQQIQNSIASIMLKYYDLIRQQYYLQIIQNTLDVSRKKLMIINERDIVGMAKPADVLMIQMEVNVAEQSLKFQESLIEQEKADLLQLMGEKLIYPFSLNDSIAVDNSLQFDTIAKYPRTIHNFYLPKSKLKYTNS
jgi:outer membrane protein